MNIDDAKRERHRTQGVTEAAASAYERDFRGGEWFKTPESNVGQEKPMKAENREWIQTFSGRQFFPLAPLIEDIVIEDIAHSLSLLCRFAGHTNVFYSVAEHSVRVSRLAQKYAPAGLERYYGAWGLLHDATEAYLIDLPRPLKRSEEVGAGYRKAEARLMEVICRRFKLMPAEPPEIKRADTVLLLTERRDLLGAPPKLWREDHQEGLDPLPKKIVPWPSDFAEKQFLHRYFTLHRSPI